MTPNFFFFIEVQLIYNVLVSGMQQSDSVIYIHIYMCVCVCVYLCDFFFQFFSIIGYYKILIIVPCVI